MPALGSKPLGQLTASDLREFLGEKTREGKSAATVKQIHAIIRSALQHAKRDGPRPEECGETGRGLKPRAPGGRTDRLLRRLKSS